MSKLPLFLALAALAALTSCSEEKNGPPDYAGLCKKNASGNLSEECLIGTWKLDEVVGHNDCNKSLSATLDLTGEVEGTYKLFNLTGGLDGNPKGIGRWIFNGKTISITGGDYPTPPDSGTVDVKNGTEMRIIVHDKCSLFLQCCNSNVTEKTEIFKR
jgi:hypothetical protein